MFFPDRLFLHSWYAYQCYSFFSRGWPLIDREREREKEREGEGKRLNPFTTCSHCFFSTLIGDGYAKKIFFSCSLYYYCIIIGGTLAFANFARLENYWKNFLWGQNRWNLLPQNLIFCSRCLMFFFFFSKVSGWFRRR